MTELPVYEFPARVTTGVLFGLSVARLAAVGLAGVVLIVVMSGPSPSSMLVGLALIAVLLSSSAVKVGGRAAVDWLPTWFAHGWRMASRRNEFYASPDLADELPDSVLDLPGELFGLELHTHSREAAATIANPTPVGYGVVRDTFRQRVVAIAEISAPDFLFLDPDEQQGRINAWGRLLDHVAQSLPEVTRLQLVHTVGSASAESMVRHRDSHGGRGNAATAESYEQTLVAAGTGAQDHRLLLAIALDLRQARRQIRQAGGGIDGAAQLLMDRAATIEDALGGSGVAVNGWLPARSIAQVLKVAFDPAGQHELDRRPPDVNAGGGIDPAAAGPSGIAESWSALRHDSGWSTTLQILRPPTRPVTGDFLQHLLIGVEARRRLSMLYVPTPAAAAERRAQTQQVSSESEQSLRARWGFGTSARQRRSWQDAARREEDLVEGRAVYRVVWLVTVTASTPGELEIAVGQVQAAARLCSLELRQLAGTQRQAFGFTLPLCRGAR